MTSAVASEKSRRVDAYAHCGDSVTQSTAIPAEPAYTAGAMDATAANRIRAFIVAG
jgi:predicted phosphodiesterase